MPDRPPLSPSEVHVWGLRLDAVPSDEAIAALSAEERDRAGRFRTPTLRHRFAAAHRGLRSVLARYLEALPAEISLVVDERGKPRLAGSPEVHFSLARSGSLALVALARQEVGVDVEEERHGADLLTAALRALPSDDAARVAATPEESQASAFYAAWTALEARVKCSGRGLSGSLEPREDIVARPINVPNGYSAAVAAHGADWKVRPLEWA